MLCFTFNVFAVNIVTSTQDPQIIIDGMDRETVWMDSNEVVFEAIPEIGGRSTVDMLHYKNTVYGLINFYTHLEDELDFVLRVDFHYNKNSVYILFVINKQLVFYSDGEFAMEGMCRETEDGYCAEFSFDAAYNMFAYGDLLQIEVKYGAMGEVDDYENVYGFMGREQYDFYVGGQLIEAPNTQKTTRPNNNNSNKTAVSKETTKSINDATVAYNNSASVVDANYMNNKETAIIIIVMTLACFVMFIVFMVSRRNDGKKPKYTDDDKGCD